MNFSYVIIKVLGLYDDIVFAQVKEIFNLHIKISSYLIILYPMKMRLMTFRRTLSQLDALPVTQQ